MSDQIEELAEHFQSLVGTKTEKYLGEITPLLIQRYALAVGDKNPLYFDKSFAQQHGYPDIIAPPNLLASVIEWGVGVDEEFLHRDGMPQVGFLPSHFKGIKIMGGGEEKTFYRPVVAGTKVTLTNEITETYTKQGSKGLMAFLVETNTYRDQDDNVLCVCKRTTIAR